MQTLIRMGESRINSAQRRNYISFQSELDHAKIDRTESSFAGKSKMTMKQLKEAAKARRAIAKLY